MKATKENAKHMIDVYNWSINQLIDISLYGPPTAHVYYLLKYSGETREKTLREDLDRLAYWEGVLNE